MSQNYIPTTITSTVKLCIVTYPHILTKTIFYREIVFFFFKNVSSTTLAFVFFIIQKQHKKMFDQPLSFTFHINEIVTVRQWTTKCSQIIKQKSI